MAAPLSSRRGLLAGAAALAAPVAAAAASTVPAVVAHPDTELIGLCETWRERMAAFDRACDRLGNVPDGDPAWRLVDDAEALEDRILAIRPVTAEGYVARLRCAAAQYLPGAEMLDDDEGTEFCERVERATLRHLLTGRA